MEAVDLRDELEADLESTRSTMAYVYRSEYHKHLAMWNDHFDPRQHHIIIFEELLNTPQKALKLLHEFLEVPYSSSMEYLRLKNPASDEHAKRVSVSPEEISRLTDVLRPTVEKMEALLDRELAVWHR